MNILLILTILFFRVADIPTILSQQQIEVTKQKNREALIANQVRSPAVEESLLRQAELRRLNTHKKPTVSPTQQYKTFNTPSSSFNSKSPHFNRDPGSTTITKAIVTSINNVPIEIQAARSRVAIEIANMDLGFVLPAAIEVISAVRL